MAIGEDYPPKKMHLSLRIQQSGAMIQTVDSYLKKASTVHEIMKRRALKFNNSAVRGLTGTLFYAPGFMFYCT